MSSNSILTECINFGGVRDKKGYGIATFEGKGVRAHRLAYCNHNGLELQDIKNLVIRHKCDNPSCVNPDHLEAGSQADNIRDMMERGRHKYPGYKGEQNGQAKLSQQDVENIRQRYQFRSRINGTYAIAKDYGISQKQISRIVRGEKWR